MTRSSAEATLFQSERGSQREGERERDEVWDGQKGPIPNQSIMGKFNPANKPNMTGPSLYHPHIINTYIHQMDFTNTTTNNNKLRPCPRTNQRTSMP